MPERAHSKLKIFLIAAGVSVLGIGVALAIFLAGPSPLSRRWAVNALQKRYHSDVRLDRFEVTVFPHIIVRGGGLVLSNKDHPGAPPLASLKRFSMEATWLGLLRHPRRVRHVRLEGLQINVPPRRHGGQPGARKQHHLPPLYFADIEANGTVLRTFSDDPQKPPRVFDISKLRLKSVGVGKPMSFEATLTNPKPIGRIHTSGRFGPWNADDPGQTAVSGKYEFRNADLSTIRGIAGILASNGEFNGVLNRIEVDGTTATPQFALGAGSYAEPLKTRFHAIVDGSTGQSLLQPVRADLAGSLIAARGGVLRKAGAKGTTVLLNVTTSGASLGNILRLAVNSEKPPMEGAISLQTRFEVVPGPEDMKKRLRLDGKFTIQTARFTDPAVEAKVTQLSESGRGKPGERKPEGVPSNFNGHFKLSGGTIFFSRLSFEVPGAAVSLHGSYGLLSEKLSFLGTLRLQASGSQATTGIKSVLLRAIDPLLKGKHAGTVVPIKITGNRNHPQFGLRFGRLWTEIL